MADDIVIRAEGLSKRYRIGALQEPYGSLRESLMRAVKSPFSGVKNREGTFWALKDVSFEIKRGEVVGIIGRNGAGKSTLLKILARITKPTDGRAVIRGRVGSLLEVGTGFHPELTGRENVFLNGAILGMRRVEIERRFDEIVEFAEIEQFLDTPVKRYSSGMYVRLAFAVAAHLEPEILLVDEVLAVGDAQFQNKCLGKMAEVASQGRTVLFVSHNLASIASLCDRVILFRKGVTIHDGEVTEAFDKYMMVSNRNSQSSPFVSLLHAEGRPGHYKTLIRSLRLTNQLGIENSEFKMGETIVFEINVRSAEDGFSADDIGIGIDTLFGQRICTFLWSYQSTEPLIVTEPKIIRCVWQKCNLLPGRYFVKLALNYKGQCIDEIEQATSIGVVESDIYGTGRFFGSGFGIISSEASWSIVKSYGFES